MIILKIVAFLVGLFMLVGSIMNYDSLLTGRREDRIVKLIGRTGLRVLYGLTGAIATFVLLLDFLGIFRIPL